MRRIHIFAILLLAALAGSDVLFAQNPPTGRIRGGAISGYEIEGRDTIITIDITPVHVYSRPKRMNMRQYERLIKNVKKVYPYAMEAKEYMRSMEEQLAKLTSSRDREKFIAKMEKEIVVKYTPVLEKMTFSQGKILIKLIDRETNQTPYQILRDFRGRFTAGFYNAIAKIFKADLKQHYDPTKGEDAVIEHIIMKIEEGVL